MHQENFKFRGNKIPRREDVGGGFSGHHSISAHSRELLGKWQKVKPDPVGSLSSNVNMRRAFPRSPPAGE